MWNFLANLLGMATTQPDSDQEASTRQTALVVPPSAQRATIGARREDRRARYIRTQAYQLAERFSKDGGQGIQLDEQNYNWLIIPKYPMPERWRQRWTRLMILFPAAYPDVPPTGFYLRIDAGLKGGGRDRHLFNGGGFYDGAPDLSAHGWFWYCVHAQIHCAGGWQPSSDPAYPDNLFTFQYLAREALSTDA